MALLGQKALTRERAEAPTWSAGRATKGSTTTTPFVASVQPLRGRDRVVLPEGVRHSDGRKLYHELARDFLRVDDQHVTPADPADVVVIPDVGRFRVVHVDDDHPEIPHVRVYITRIQEGAT
jgi:hypothetical protein